MKPKQIALGLFSMMLITWSYTVQAEDKHMHEGHKTGNAQHDSHGEMSTTQKRCFWKNEKSTVIA